ncbi:MAG: bifunctional phosphopantothenoylcysteine decarboxylase/phosphopantothenate--cysteine ligase CoaBC [Saprospiraceae bacterium]|nr:bifunctional phosphopantothenoylcysteine decarboxylase/phosphopantothenate--cysteine ligase CoaBC [Saprospiraceae bacterium]
MSQLAGKKILLGISGSIAAYKAAFLTRLLIKHNAEVQVLMTPSAMSFISPLTLSTLSKRPVYTDVIGAEGWNNHVEIGLWADALVLAPVTANTLSKLASGQSDNMLVASYLSARCPVFIAPAMDLDMWKHPATRRNVALLEGAGNHFLEVGYGELASGLIGEGRMAEPEEILTRLESFFGQQQDLVGKKVLITAGPTFEPIDPVRFIGNRSSGKMGIALAISAARRGAMVRLVLGPTSLTVSHPNIEVVRVQTAREMFNASCEGFENIDLAILAAAVADYRPKDQASEKIKKSGNALQLELVQNPDIAATLGKMKKAGQILVGFALETQNEEAHARAKLERKNLDMIVLNSLRDPGAGFNHDTNRIRILHRENNKTADFELKSKAAVAEDILDSVLHYYLT